MIKYSQILFMFRRKYDLPIRYSNFVNVSRNRRYQSTNHESSQKSNQSSQSSQSNHREEVLRERNTTLGYFFGVLAFSVFGLSYASVPLYKVFCTMTGFGGTTRKVDQNKPITVKPVENGKLIRIDFASNVHSAMPWSFVPTQKSIRVIPGETALAFYTVKNPTDRTITGVATYNVSPPKSGLYFNKIQCFCFEEQRLGPGEEIDMPIFFYIDPEILQDPSMKNITNITLAYTFFKTGEEKNDSSLATVTVAPNPATVNSVHRINTESIPKAKAAI